MKTLVLIQSQGLLRDGLTNLLRRSNRFEIVGQSPELSSIEHWLDGETPSCIIISSSMLHSLSLSSTYLDLIRSHNLDSSKPQVNTIIFIERNDEMMVDQFQELGVHGFVFERATFWEFEQSLQALYEGGVYLPSFMAEQQREYGAPASQVLTIREKQVLQRVSMGMSSKAISQELGIAVSTVDVYRKRLQAKLRVHSVAELTKCALRLGLTSL